MWLGFTHSAFKNVHGLITQYVHLYDSERKHRQSATEKDTAVSSKWLKWTQECANVMI